MKAHRLKKEEVLTQLKTSQLKGLSDGQAVESGKIHGANVLSRAKRKNIFLKIGASLLEPMMLILLIAFGITLTVNIIRVSRGENFDIAECVGIFVAIVLSVSISLFMEGKSEKAFLALSNFGGSLKVMVLRGGVWGEKSATVLVVGDIVKLGTGDKIACDGRLLKSDGLSVDESPLTGESEAVKKDSEKVFNNDPYLAERINMVYGGCFVVQGSGEMVVTAVGDKSELGTIAAALKKVSDEKTPLQQKLSKLGKWVALLGALSAAVVFIVQLVQLIVWQTVSFDTVQEIFITSIVLIVAAVPEGLPTIVALSLALNVVKMAKANALVKKMAACETVGSVSVICSDKTGTLTENKMTVGEFVLRDGKKINVEKMQDKWILSNIALNSTAELGKEKGTQRDVFLGNPTECALLASHEKSNQKISYREKREKNSPLRVFPFSSETKRMSTVIDEGQNAAVYCKGAPEVVLGLCSISAGEKQQILAQIAFYQANAKRVIAFAHKVMQKSFTAISADSQKNIEENLIFDGFAVISDPIRKEVYKAVKDAKRAKIEIKMLTGDHVATATAIARELGIVEVALQNGVFEASQIDTLSDDELSKLLPYIKVVARSTPTTKLRIVQALKNMGEVVAVTGDGVNDAPAIKAADVGIAMGIAGTEVSKEAADMVVLDDSFSTIVSSVKWGRGIYENFQRFILFQLTVNISAVFVTVLSILLGVGAPFNALQLLWINLIMDGPPALSLGLEPIYKGLLDRTPVRRDSNIVSKTMAWRIGFGGFFVGTVVLLQALTNFLQIPTERERTVLFTLFIVFQLFNAFNARELGNESLAKGFMRNKLMLCMMAVTFALQILITQVGGVIFGTVPLSFIEWLKIFSVGISVIFVFEVIKFFKRKKRFSRHSIQKKDLSF